MTPAEAAAFLRRYNEWRRTDDRYGMPYPDPREIGVAIDAAIEMIDRLEAAEKSDAESLAMYRKARDERDALRAALQHEADCVEAAKAKIEAQRSKIEAMEKQEPVWFIDERGEPKRYHKSKADYCKYGGLDLLYALPGARPNDEALWQTIVNGMITPAHTAQAVADGTITPAYIMQPAPSVPDGFSREDLEAVADGLDGYEKTVNVGNVTGGGDDHLESTTAYAARFIRAMLAKVPEAKP